MRALRLRRARRPLVPSGMRPTWLALLPLPSLTVALEGAGVPSIDARTSVLADPTAARRLPVGP